MKIVVIGASGTIGTAVVEELGSRHEVIRAGRNGADLSIDITDTSSIQSALASVGQFDALVSATGSVHFGPLEEMNEEKYDIGIRNKLMGQVNLVLIGRDYIADNGSFTLTTGVLSHDPIHLGSSAAMVNGAVDSFATAAAIEMPRGLRINTVSPGVITEALPHYAPYFRGFEPVPAAKAARAYAKSVEGLQTGRVFHVQ